jgi:uncharacterized membrane protein
LRLKKYRQVQWDTLLFGIGAMVCSVGAAVRGRFRSGRHGPYYTPETHPHGFWATVIIVGLLGLALIVWGLAPWVADLRRARRKKKRRMRHEARMVGNQDG